MSEVTMPPKNIISFPTAATSEAHGFYSFAEAARIARVNRSLAASWRRDGIIGPTVEWINEDGVKELGYDFEGIVYLRLLKMLRDSGISLGRAVDGILDLTKRFGPPGQRWADARIFSDHGVIYVHSKADRLGTTTGRQIVGDPLFGPEFAQLRDRADALLVPRRYQKHIEISPTIRNGLPIIRETTIPSNIIYKLRKKGLTYKAIQQSYPIIPLERLRGADHYEKFLDLEAQAA